MRKIIFVFLIGSLFFLLFSCLGYSPIDSLNYLGIISDENGNPIEGVIVTNGFDAVKSDEEGFFRIYKRIAARFVTISMPSGYKANSYFIPISKEIENYNFELTTYSQSAGSNVNFVHIGDSETTTGGEWVDNIKQYAKAHNTAFLIHTGDICYKEGMEFHSQNVNSESMGLPVYYTIGNHDLIEGGEYGEEFFENLFGPTYYSFNAGGVHFIVTPMLNGDATPSYSKEQVSNWLKKDLALIPENTPLVVFNHDLYSYGEDFDYGRVNLAEYNLIAWAYGHWHINFFKEHGDSGIVSWTTAPPNKGGIDHSTASFPVVSINDGNLSIETRYPYFTKHIRLPAPAIAIIYDTALDPESISYTSMQDGFDKETVGMQQIGTMTWKAILNDTNFNGARIEITYSDGSISTKQVDNFGIKKSLIAPSGQEIFLTPPIVENDKIYSASQNDTGSKNHHIFCYKISTGEEIWKYKTIQSIRNKMVYYNGNICAVDAESNIYILNSESGNITHFIPTTMSNLGQNMGGCSESSGILYAGFGNGFKAVNITSGEVLWINDSWSGGEGTVTYPVISNNIVLTGSNWRAFYAHSITTGKTIWSATENSVRYQSSTPIIDGNTIISINDRNLNFIDLNTGQFNASYKTAFSFNISGSPVLDSQTLFCPTAANGVVALNKNDGSTKWQYKSADALIFTSPYTGKGDSPVSTVEGSPVLLNEKIYFGASDGFVYCLNSSDGTLVWKEEVGAPIIASLTLANGNLYCNDFTGNIWEITP